MMLHIRPRCVVESRCLTRIDLIDLRIPELEIHLHAGSDLTARRHRYEAAVLGVCRNSGRNAIDGILLETRDVVSSFNVLTRWGVSYRSASDQEISRDVTHHVNYLILDSEFNTASDDMLLRNLYGWTSRMPAWAAGLAPAGGEPTMSLQPGGRVQTCVDDIEDGVVLERSETFAMPTIEADRVVEAAIISERMPDPGDRFQANKVGWA